MSSLEEKDHRTEAERSAQREKMHRHIAEVCDREARESIHEWHLRHAERDEEDDQSQPNPTAVTA
ncbi:MAG: hypothetical protein FWD31_08895 [Planctomycetaceae bacterium]|nr:hypothetical protein [Planctomycetaceae bacterium]